MLNGLCSFAKQTSGTMWVISYAQDLAGERCLAMTVIVLGLFIEWNRRMTHQVDLISVVQQTELCSWIPSAHCNIAVHTSAVQYAVAQHACSEQET